jgi:hypothetical protein
MKFQTLSDIQMFLLEIDKGDLIYTVNEKFQPTIEMVEEFIKRRRGLISKLRDFRKSQDSKRSWRQNKHKYKSAIKRFHKSTEGKKMHRKLGDFIANREFRDNRYNEELDFSVRLHEVSEVLKSISSLKTHMFIESEYYAPIASQLIFEELMMECVPELSLIESSILFDNKLDEEKYDMLITITHPDSLAQCINEVCNSKLILSGESINEELKEFEEIYGIELFEILKNKCAYLIK